MVRTMVRTRVTCTMVLEYHSTYTCTIVPYGTMVLTMDGTYHHGTRDCFEEESTTMVLEYTCTYVRTYTCTMMVVESVHGLYCNTGSKAAVIVVSHSIFAN